LNEENNVNIISSLITLGSYAHGVKPDNFRLRVDKNLGSGTLKVTASQKRLCDDLIASAKNPLGNFNGERFKFNDSFKANLVEMVYAARLINLKSELLKKYKLYKFHTINFFMLTVKMNTLAGLRENTEAYFSKVIKAILKASMSPYIKDFPGGWKHSLRQTNYVKNDVQTLLSMGWVPKVPSSLMLNEVLFNTVDPLSSNKYREVNITQDKRSFLFQEFRTAVALVLPRIDTEMKDINLIEKHLKTPPFGVTSIANANIFVEPKRDLLVDSLNRAYAFKVTTSDPKQKTKLVHYKQARERFINMSVDVTLKDSEGRIFQKFSELPSYTQKFLRDKYRFHEKRGIDAVTPGNTDVTMTDVAANATTEQSSSKKARLTKGQVKTAVRRSGRLAQKVKA
jgi:hypothetical protein